MTTYEYIRIFGKTIFQMNKLLLIITTLLLYFNSFSQTPGNSLATQLLKEKSTSKRIELIFQLAGISVKQISSSNQEKVRKTLLKWYQQEPDAGLHSAVDYLLRYPESIEMKRKLNWGLPGELATIDKQLQAKGKGSGNWFMAPQLQTMSVIKGPVTFTMGSPANEQYRTDDELQHQSGIPRSFAICTKEVTVSQFQQFLEENPRIKEAARKDSFKFPSVENKRMLTWSPETDCPQIYVTWYEAAQYCNWLSKLDGIPESEWCYPSNELLQSGMEISSNYLKRKGYRLPTETEWEYAARAGSTTSHYFGESDELLDEYAWYSKNPPKKKSDPVDPNDPQHTYPVGQLRPNNWGLFDVYGNVWEWCDSRRQPYISGNMVDNPTTPFIITDSTAMTRRGGSFSYERAVMRSAHRGVLNYFPNQRRDNVGFRIAKTISAE
jgi:formylglycine-generating enzyme required for sulfatase activity